MKTSANSGAFFYIIFGSVVGSPSPFNKFLQVLFHKSKLTFNFSCFLFTFRTFSLFAVPFIFQRLCKLEITASPLDLGGESSVVSPFQALRALFADIWTWMIRCLVACCSASGILNSNNLSLSVEGSNLAIFSIILQTLTLHLIISCLPCRRWDWWCWSN